MRTVPNLKSLRTAAARRRALRAVTYVVPIVVAAVFLAALLPGCGSDSSSSGKTHKSTPTATPTATPSSTVSALWVPNAGGNSVDAYTLAQLSTGGNVAPSVDISGSNTQLAMPEGVCFDPSGNLWVVNCVGSKQPSSIVKFDAADLATGGNLTPTAVISGFDTRLECSVTCDFDSAGDLWVVNDDSQEQIEDFTPSQLQGGNISPAVVFFSGNYLCNSAGLIFDPSGNLWASGLCFNNLSGFSPTQLAAGGTPTPQYQIGGGNTALNQPLGITFDAGGNLWVANSAQNGGTPGAIEFAAADLATGGNIAPAVTVAGNNTLMNTPQGVAFDPSGNLWVAQSGSKALTGYNATALVTGGNVAPFSVISGSNTKLNGPFTIKFH